MGWRFETREAMENLRSSAVMTAARSVLAALVGFGVIAVTATDTIALLEDWTEYEMAGRSSFSVVGRTEAISAHLCDAANSIDGVRGAGAVLSRNPTETSLPTRDTIDIARVTPGYLDAAWYAVPPRAIGLVAPVDLATKFGLVDGSYVRISDVEGTPKGLSTNRRIDWAATSRSRVDGINDALIVVAAARGDVNECLVTAEPRARRSVKLALEEWFGSGATVIPFLQGSLLVGDPDEAYRHRSSQWLAAALASAVAIVLIMNWNARKADFALYRILGMPRRRIQAMLSMEFALVTLAPFSVGAVFGLYTAASAPAETVYAIMTDLLRAFLILVVAFVLSLAFVGKRTVYDRLRGG